MDYEVKKGKKVGGRLGGAQGEKCPWSWGSGRPGVEVRGSEGQKQGFPSHLGRTFLLTPEQSDIWVPISLACSPCSRWPLPSLEYGQTDTVQGNPDKQIPTSFPGILGESLL